MDIENDGLDLEEQRQASPKNWAGELSWYLLILGFIAILLAALCFFLYRNRPLTYNDFTINANVLGRYLLSFGVVCYVVGRTIQYVRRFKARRKDF